MWKFIGDVVHEFVSSFQPDVGRGFLHVSNVFLLWMYQVYVIQFSRECCLTFIGDLCTNSHDSAFVIKTCLSQHGFSVAKHVWLVCLFVRFFAGKVAHALQRECSFSSEISNELQCKPDISRSCISRNWIYRGRMLDPIFWRPRARYFSRNRGNFLGPIRGRQFFAKFAHRDSLCSRFAGDNFSRNQLKPTCQCGLEHMLCDGQPR